MEKKSEKVLSQKLKSGSNKKNFILFNPKIKEKKKKRELSQKLKRQLTKKINLRSNKSKIN